ncbi:MAG: HAMP domain-containing sensor histidine kinase, partial [Bacteroidales bacterium]|nr:HAMP domain-containing sensor histidine kinase [Bacteroidales bacterium]
MKISMHKHKRIPLLFFLGIGIPCLLLGYLAFRGIQNDQALLEKERLNEHRKILELITRSVEENIFKAEQAFLYIIAENQEIDQPGLIRSMDSLKKQNPLVEEVFFYENFEKIHFPIAKLLFLPNGSTQSFSASSRTPTSVRKVPTGQQLEFQQKKYQKAIASYQQEFEQVSDPQMKGELLSAIARVQKKSTLFRDAKKTYEVIARDYNHVQTAGGVPLGLAARLEISSLSMAINDTLSAIKTYLNLYKDLLNREWTLEKAQYDFFSQDIKESIDDIFSQAPLAAPLQPFQSAFTILKAEENNQRKITERLLTFQENAAADLKAKVSLNPEEPRSSAWRFTLESGEHTYLVSLLGEYTGNGSQVNEIRGLLLNADYLRDNLLRQVLQSNVYSGKTGWIVKGRDDRTILKSENSPSGSITVRTNFEGGFPPWFVEFYQQDPDLFETFLISRRGIYFYMFFLLAGILIFGLTLTIRTVSHELELSKMKSDFVSTISHEFKSPLSSIRQLSEMLQSGRVPSEERRVQYYDVLVEQSERLSLLIDNILDFAKIEEGRKKFDFEMVDICPLLQEIVSTFQDRVRHKDFVIQVKIDKPLPSIKVDRTAITQAITNLIDNAIKYSGEAKNIFVQAFVENQYLIITVKDFGIGIRKEEIDKVFERFYRGGDALTRTVKGSGL